MVHKQIKRKTWQELLTQSSTYDKLSKPEILVVIDILSSSDEPLTISQIHETFSENYCSTITRRQISYCIELMESSKIIENGSTIEKEKLYSLIDIKEKMKLQLTIFQGIILGLTAISFLFFKDILLFGILTGEIIIIVSIQIEYAFFVWKNKNIYINYI